MGGKTLGLGSSSGTRTTHTGTGGSSGNSTGGPGGAGRKSVSNTVISVVPKG